MRAWWRRAEARLERVTGLPLTEDGARLEAARRLTASFDDLLDRLDEVAERELAGPKPRQRWWCRRRRGAGR
jgi:hypothetical protein